MARLLTSTNNPLQIAELSVGTGMIGITFAPGKQQAGQSGQHARDLPPTSTGLPAGTPPWS